MIEHNIIGIPLPEWVGYIASILVLISLTMTSIVKLRWYNLAGAILFSTYGFLIDSLPVGIMNFLIVCANLYNLRKMYLHKEDFKIIELKANDELLIYFLDFYKKDIQNFFPDFKMQKGQLGMFILRDMAVAGIFIGSLQKQELKIELDYALPQYRDFKVGGYLYNRLSNLIQQHNIDSVYCDTGMNLKYMEKMGFVTSEKDGKPIMLKTLKKASK